MNATSGTVIDLSIRLWLNIKISVIDAKRKDRAYTSGALASERAEGVPSITTEHIGGIAAQRIVRRDERLFETGSAYAKGARHASGRCSPRAGHISPSAVELASIRDAGDAARLQTRLNAEWCDSSDAGRLVNAGDGHGGKSGMMETLRTPESHGLGRDEVKWMREGRQRNLRMHETTLSVGAILIALCSVDGAQQDSLESNEMRSKFQRNWSTWTTTAQEARQLEDDEQGQRTRRNDTWLLHYSPRHQATA